MIESNEISRLTYIKDISKLLRRNSSEDKSYYSSRYLSASFLTIELLNKHLESCMKHEAISACYPIADELDRNGNRKDVIKF